ncbi:HTH-type transcriptional regulator sinR, partial [Dysosmobacter welbionis]
QLHALRHERHCLPGHSGDRRVQALPPQAAVHHVQDGSADGSPDQVRQHRGPDHAPQPPRRRRHLRHHGAPLPGLRRPADAFCGFQRQLRQGLLPGHGLGRPPVHRGQAD